MQRVFFFNLQGLKTDLKAIMYHLYVSWQVFYTVDNLLKVTLNGIYLDVLTLFT